MAYPGPRNPEENFPDRVLTKVVECPQADNSEKKEDDLSAPELLLLIVAALRVLDNREGSSMQEIRRVLVSGGYITPSMDVRPALVLGLKRNVIRRPLSAVKAGIYGRYVEVEGVTLGELFSSKRKRKKGVSGRRASGPKKVKRCGKDSKRCVSGAERYRLAL